LIPVSSIVFASTVALVPAGGDEPLWNRFRGPNGAGVSEGATLPDTLDGETAIAWRTEIPSGYSSPVVGRRDVFVTAVDELALYTLCIDRETGEVRWRATAPRELERKSRGPNSPVSSTPTTDGENVYAFFENFGIVSYGPDGKERWRHALDSFNTPYGMGSSPIWVDGMVVMQCDQDLDSYVLALDAATGAERWRTARPDATHGFSTPIVLHPTEGPAERVLSGSYRVVADALGSGKDEIIRSSMN
jgi:outer membrane protein assembly factor BamB